MEELNLALVGWFFNFRPSINMIRKWVSFHWKLKGSISTSTLLGDFFLFWLISMEDLSQLLSSSWAYGKQPLTLAKWKSSFDPSVNLACMTLVWVFLLGLPLELWYEDIF